MTRRGLLGRSSYILNDPEAIRRFLVENQANYARTVGTIRILRPILGDGLLISEGAEWRHQRRTLAPAFTPRAIDGLVPHIDRAVTDGIAALRPVAAAGPVDLFATFHSLALDIAGRAMFSVGMDRQGPQLRAFIAEYSVRIGRPHVLDVLMPPGWPTPLGWPRARFPEALDSLPRFADQGPRRSRREFQRRSPRSPDRRAQPGDGQPFNLQELRDQVATMILAGHETTAGTLFWASYMLALCPEIQEQVAAEARAADLTDPDRLPRGWSAAADPRGHRRDVAALSGGLRGGAARAGPGRVGGPSRRQGRHRPGQPLGAAPASQAVG